MSTNTDVFTGGRSTRATWTSYDLYERSRPNWMRSDKNKGSQWTDTLPVHRLNQGLTVRRNTWRSVEGKTLISG